MIVAACIAAIVLFVLVLTPGSTTEDDRLLGDYEDIAYHEEVRR